MTLIGIRSDDELMRLAIELVPVLLIDCANCANIHKFPEVPLEKLNQVYVVPAESLYRFKPTLLNLKDMIFQLGVKNVFISSFTHLFNYDDEEENRNIYEYAWELISRLSEEYLFVVGVKKDSFHDELAKKHNITYWEDIMGHTTWSQRIVSDMMLKELEQYGRALKEEDRQHYLKLLKEPLKHLGSISNASSLHVWAFLLLSIMVEQQKKIDILEQRIIRA